MVRDSTTNQFAMVILEISMDEQLRLDLWALGLLFSNFSNTYIENTFVRSTKSTDSIFTKN